MWVCATGARHSKCLERRCPRTACLRRGPKIIYSYYTRCALIRDRRPTAWVGCVRSAETEATCIWEVSLQIVVGTVGEITVGHRTFSEHFRHLSDQKSIRSAKLSERATSNERPRARATRARALFRHICFARSINHEENYKSCSVRQ